MLPWCSMCREITISYHCHCPVNYATIQSRDAVISTPSNSVKLTDDFVILHGTRRNTDCSQLRDNAAWQASDTCQGQCCQRLLRATIKHQFRHLWNRQRMFHHPDPISRMVNLPLQGNTIPWLILPNVWKTLPATWLCLSANVYSREDILLFPLTPLGWMLPRTLILPSHIWLDHPPTPQISPYPSPTYVITTNSWLPVFINQATILTLEMLPKCFMLYGMNVLLSSVY